MSIKRTETLVYSDLGANSYKSYRIELHDDGRVVSHFSAVGKTEQTCDYGCVGEAFLDKKVKEKLKKGYEYAKIISADASQSAPQISRGSLADIAVSQIKYTNTAIKDLIRQLANANVHKICAATSITFNTTSGLFQTPLGVVTQEALDEARNLLAFFAKSTTVNASYKTKLDGYLRLIPRVKSHKMRYEDIFPTPDAIQKESDVLDALESSLAVVSSPAPAPVGQTAAPAVEQVFDLHLDVLDDAKERQRLSDWFYSSNHRTHGYSNVKIREIYKIHQPSVPFDEKIGNFKEVFHGTSEANVLSCLKGGLRTSPPSTVAIAGKMWGNGIYGALDSSKSLQYSFGRFTGNGGASAHLFVADFALGRLEIPKRKRGGPNTSQYDSVWAKTQNTGLRFDEIIVFRDRQVKIKYLITAK